MELRGSSKFTVCFLVLFLLAVALQPFVYAVGSSVAMQRINAAEASLTDAFLKVSDAEGAGGNVSGLIGRLNEASRHLDLAKVAYANGSFDVAYDEASTCISLAGNVAGDAVSLKSQAQISAGGWWMVVAFSVIGAAVFSFVLYAVWVWFRRFYSGKALGMRPEVKG